jgi:hypothetical protein
MMVLLISGAGLDLGNVDDATSLHPLLAPFFLASSPAGQVERYEKDFRSDQVLLERSGSAKPVLSDQSLKISSLAVPDTERHLPVVGFRRVAVSARRGVRWRSQTALLNWLATAPAAR